MTTAAAYVPAAAHTKTGHPENQRRISQILPFLEKAGILTDINLLEPAQATIEQLRRVHAPALIERIREVSTIGGGTLDLGDTYATPESYELARLAAGSTIAVVDQILTKQARNGFALVRPPGHHAEYNRVSGFCLFNNIAAAARQAQAVYGVKRSLIVDFDVHHGNGTQDIFYEDDSVMFILPICFYPACFIRERGICGNRGMDLGMATR
jgi:acetoin utilization deacetylase AcuC-like enzyme